MRLILEKWIELGSMGRTEANAHTFALQNQIEALSDAAHFFSFHFTFIHCMNIYALKMSSTNKAATAKHTTHATTIRTTTKIVAFVFSHKIMNAHPKMIQLLPKNSSQFIISHSSFVPRQTHDRRNTHIHWRSRRTHTAFMPFYPVHFTPYSTLLQRYDVIQTQIHIHTPTQHSNPRWISQRHRVENGLYMENVHMHMNIKDLNWISS